jgi:hypothetical protein
MASENWEVSLTTIDSNRFHYHTIWHPAIVFGCHQTPRYLARNALGLLMYTPAILGCNEELRAVTD